MFALSSEEDALLQKVLPGVRPPPGKAAGRLVPDCLFSMEANPRLLPRLPQAGSGGYTARGPTPPPALPTPSAPLGPLVRPGKTIESVLRAMPSSGSSAAAALCGTKGPRTWPSVDSPGAASEPSPRERRRREPSRDHSQGISGRGEAAVDDDKVTFSPRPPIDGRPPGIRKLGGRRASSEGPHQHGMDLLQPGSAEKSSSRSKRTPRERMESLDTKSRAPAAPSSSRGAEAKRSNRASGLEENGGHRKSGAPLDAQPSPRGPRPRSLQRAPSPSLEFHDPSAEQEAPPVASSQQVAVRVLEPRPVKSARGEAAEWFNLFLKEAEAEADTAIAETVTVVQAGPAEGSQICTSDGTGALPGPMPQERNSRLSRASSADSNASSQQSRTGNVQALPGPLPRMHFSRPSSAGSSAAAAAIEETDIVGTRPTRTSSRDESNVAGEVSNFADAAEPQAVPVASNPLILEEMDNEREMWEAKSMQLLMANPFSSSGAPPHPEHASTATSATPEPPAPVVEALPNNAGVEPSEALTRLPANAEKESCEDSLIVAALKAAGLQPGPEARTALLQGGLDACSAPSLQVVTEEQEHDESATNGLAVGPGEGSSRWAMSAREWAQQRLRRKRERVGGSSAT